MKIEEPLRLLLQLLLEDDHPERALGSAYPNGGASGPSYGSYQDHSVPFPRTSGARFCSAG